MKSATDPHATRTHRPQLVPHVGIVVLNYNGLGDTLDCLESLAAVRSRDVSVWVVDNASADDPRAAIQQRFPWCHLVRNACNGGWAGGNNTGIRIAIEAGCDWIMLLNNDTRVSPAIVERLLDAAKTDPGLGVIGPLINEWEPPDQVQTACCFFNRLGGGAVLSAQMEPPHRQDPPLVYATDIVNGCCMMIRVDVVETIGLIDEAFFLVHEESDFCLRAAEAGYRCGVLAESHVWHKHSASFGREASPLQRYFGARNSWRLIRKHRRWPGGNGPWASRWMVLRHCWHLIDFEHERGEAAAARAVIDGVADAWSNRFGPQPVRARPLARLADLLLKAVSTARRSLRRSRCCDAA